VESNAWLPEEQVEYDMSFPTSLLALSSEDFDLIARHGYSAA